MYRAIALLFASLRPIHPLLQGIAPIQGFFVCWLFIFLELNFSYVIFWTYTFLEAAFLFEI